MFQFGTHWNVKFLTVSSRRSAEVVGSVSTDESRQFAADTEPSRELCRVLLKEGLMEPMREEWFMCTEWFTCKGEPVREDRDAANINRSGLGHPWAECDCW